MRLIYIIYCVGSCLLKLSRFRILKKLTKFLKNWKKLAIMQSSPMTKHLSNIIIFGPVSPEIMRPEFAIFGGSHLSWAVLAILYKVLHSFYRFLWVMRQGLALVRAQSSSPRPLVKPYQTLYWTRLVQQLRTKTAQLRCPAQLTCPAS